MVNTCLGLTVGPEGIPGCDFSDYAAIYTATGKLSGTQLIYQQVPDPANPGQTVSVPFAKERRSGCYGFTSGSGATDAYAALHAEQGLPPTALNPIINNYAASGTGLFNSDQWTVRGDYTFNEKTAPLRAFLAVHRHAFRQSDVRRSRRSGIRPGRPSLRR